MLFLEGSIESFFGKFSPGNNGENVYRIGNKDDIENVVDFDNVDTDGFSDNWKRESKSIWKYKTDLFRFGQSTKFVS